MDAGESGEIVLGGCCLETRKDERGRTVLTSPDRACRSCGAEWSTEPLLDDYDEEFG
jgi:hypothetical protein